MCISWYTIKYFDDMHCAATRIRYSTFTTKYKPFPAGLRASVSVNIVDMCSLGDLSLKFGHLPSYVNAI